jgi:hypothetical protein
MYNNGLISEIIGWQEEEEFDEILEFCANQQRYTFKQNFASELEQLTEKICESDRKMFVSVEPSQFIQHLWNFINMCPVSEYKTYKSRADYYLLMNLKNQLAEDRKIMIDKIILLWKQ